MTQTSDRGEKIPLWRDDRVIRIAIQILTLAIVLLILGLLIGNMNANLQRLGRTFSFSFLATRAGFNIGEAIIPYEVNDQYFWALLVGFVNTLRLILVGFVVTTVIGVVAGIASFSDNWLLRKLNLVYVEIVRNTPLLLQLFFWYFAVFFALAPPTNLPPDQQTRELLGAFFISKKGLVMPWPDSSTASWLSFAALVVVAIAFFIVWRWRLKVMEEQGASGMPQLITLGVLGLVALFLFTLGLGWIFPTFTPGASAPQGGLRISLEYAAALMGLSFYTGAFIAEIVRGGIQAVSRGQWEAARALGFHTSLAMRLVVFPQALRVIIPSLNSQYMNLAKNSTLAFVIGYPEFFSTFQTTQNQTGRAVEMILVVMATYLVVNLIISLIMNQLNRAVQLKER